MATKKKAARPAKAAKKAVAKKPAAKKSTAKKSASRKSASRKSASKKSVSKSVATKKGAPKKKVAKRASKSGKKVAARSSASVEAAKIVIPPVPTRGTTSISTTPTPAPASTAVNSSAPTKKSSSRVLFLVVAGVVLLAIFALSNSSMDDGASPKPTPAESMTDEPADDESGESTETDGETDGESATNLTYEAPTGFVAINNGSGVTLRWKAPMATEGLTGYLVSISYNAVDFKEVATVPVGTLSLDVARVGDEGGTQFFIQSVYSDGTKADGAKFALKGKYE